MWRFIQKQTKRRWLLASEYSTRGVNMKKPIQVSLERAKLMTKIWNESGTHKWVKRISSRHLMTFTNYNTTDAGYELCRFCWRACCYRLVVVVVVPWLPWGLFPHWAPRWVRVPRLLGRAVASRSSSDSWTWATAPARRPACRGSTSTSPRCPRRPATSRQRLTGARQDTDGERRLHYDKKESCIDLINRKKEKQRQETQAWNSKPDLEPSFEP